MFKLKSNTKEAEGIAPKHFGLQVDLRGAVAVARSAPGDTVVVLQMVCSFEPPVSITANVEFQDFMPCGLHIHAAVQVD
jgi:hypothetical protein